jgi:hypothetical protein
MFTLGASREYRSPIYKSPDYIPSNMKYINTFMNGLYYASPFGLKKIYHLYKRFQEYKTRTKQYGEIYKEWSYNYNMNVLC